MADMSYPPPPPCLCNFCQRIHSCSISQFFVCDGVGPVNVEDVLKAFGLEHLVFIGL